jgi:hypothetical protein
LVEIVDVTPLAIAATSLLVLLRWRMNSVWMRAAS